MGNPRSYAAAESLISNLNALSLSTEPAHPFRGKDIPLNCNVQLEKRFAKYMDDNRFDFNIIDLEAQLPTVTIPILRKFHRGQLTYFDTVALLQGDDKTQVYGAHSGCSDAHSDLYQISNKKFWRQALEMLQSMEIEIPEDPTRDDGTPGKYAACHAEIQLLALLWGNRSDYRFVRRIFVSEPTCRGCCGLLLKWVAYTALPIDVIQPMQRGSLRRLVVVRFDEYRGSSLKMDALPLEDWVDQYRPRKVKSKTVLKVEL